MVKIVFLAGIPIAALFLVQMYFHHYERTVIVVGGGLSGLATAHYLEDEGSMSVVILEALDRLGGRVHTHTKFNTTIEMGALYIHKHVGNPMTALAKELGAKTVPFDYERCTYYDADGTPIPWEVWNSTLEYWREVVFDDFMEYRDKLQEDTDQPMSITFDDMDFYDDLPMLQRRVFDLLCFQYIVQDVQADLQDISTYEYDESSEFSGGPNADLIIYDGYSTIVEGLAEGFDVRLNTFVKTVMSGVTGVTVVDNNGVTYHASQVVVSVPIGVLKNRSITFVPPLPIDLRNAIADLGVSDTIKVAMCWNPGDVFWVTGGTHSLHFHKYAHPKHNSATSKYGRGEHMEFVNLHEIYGSGCLLMEAETAFATRLSKLPGGDDAVVDRIMEDLCLMFPGPRCVRPNRGVVVSAWATSPATLGGFAHWRVDAGKEENEKFAASDIHKGRLVFAGEHTQWNFFGNTHGAYLSGIAAGQRVLEIRRARIQVVSVVVLVLSTLVVLLAWRKKF